VSDDATESGVRSQGTIAAPADEPADAAADALPLAPRGSSRAVSTAGRGVAAGVLAACLCALALSAWVKPDGRGYGTHEQLGFAPCGMLVWAGLPCPTCGMTTAFAYTVRGRLPQAFWAQPSGFALALATMALAAAALWVLLTGRWPPIRAPLLTPYRLLTILLVLFLGGWAFKLAAGLLTGTLPLGNH